MDQYHECFFYGRVEVTTVATTQENEKLREDNQRLLLIVADATKQIKEASNMAEKYQRMFNNLSESVKAKYDNEFSIDNIPGH